MWAMPLGRAFAQERPQSKEGPGATPTVDGDHLYVMGLARDVACRRVDDG